MRAIAIVIVILFHSNPNVLVGGYVGVDLFFVLSAFLITSILADEYRKTGSIDLPRFYLRRLLRLGPALLLMLAGYLLVAPFLWPGEPHWRDALFAALYISDFTLPAGLGPDHLLHTWSLAIEEQFYLLWPLLLVPMLVRPHLAIPCLIAGIIVMASWRDTFAAWQDFYYRIDTHSSGLLAGALLYFMTWRTNRWVGIAGMALLLCVVLVGNRDWNNSAIVVAEIAAMMLIASVGDSKWLQAPLLVHIGQLSYGLYLWHYPIAQYLRTRLDFFETTTITLVLSYLLALLSYHTVEAWSRRMKDRMGSPKSLEVPLPG